MKALGVDIGSYSIKVAELDISSKGYTLSHFYEYPLSVDPNRDRGLEVIEILRTLSAQYDVNATRWVMCIQQQMVSVHNKKFPFRERQKILKSLAFELEDEIPLDVDEAVFDAKVVEHVGPLSSVLTVACQREVVQEALSLAKDGGFDPDILTVEGLAYSNCFENWAAAPPDISPLLRQQADEATVVGVTAALPAKLILHMGHTRTLVLAYRDHELIACRSILWGGIDVAESLSRTFSLPLMEGIKVLKTKSFILMNSAGASKDQITMSQSVSASVDLLMRETRLMLLELRANFNVNFAQIELFGGVSLIQNLCPYITQGLEVPTNLGHHLQTHKQSLLEVSPQIEAISGVAIGLAIEVLKRPRNPAVNLRRGEFARENKAVKLFWERWQTVVQVSAIAFFILVVYGFVRQSVADGMVAAVDERLKDMATTVAGLKGAQASEEGVDKYIKTTRTAIKNRESLLQLENYNSALDFIAHLSEKLPVQVPPIAGRGLNISHVAINNDDLVIEGRLQGNDLMARLEGALKEIARPKSVVKSPTTSFPPGAGNPFAFKMKINRKP
jgi:general secretion pathway protein L